MIRHPVGVSQRGNAAADGPSVSVVIPAFNAVTYLAETLESVFAQSVLPGEVIVVDDGSTDETIKVARRFDVRVISLPNRGPSAARNAGTLAANGEYVAYLDADDLWAPEKLSAQLAAFAAFGQPAFSFTDYRLFDERGFYAADSELRQRSVFRRVAKRIPGMNGTLLIRSSAHSPSLYESYIAPSSIVVRRADALAIGGFDDSLRFTEDYDFCLRMLRLVPAIVVMAPLLFYRRHSNQATANSPRMMTGYFHVAERIKSAPERYAAGDVRYMISTEYLRYYRLAIHHSRLGQFDDAVNAFRQSLSAKRNAATYLLLVGAKICRGPVGSRAFDILRQIWKRRGRGRR